MDGKQQIIVHGQAFGSGQDAKHLEPMVDGAKDNLQKIGHSVDYFKGKILTADTIIFSYAIYFPKQLSNLGRSRDADEILTFE